MAGYQSIDYLGNALLRWRGQLETVVISMEHEMKKELVQRRVGLLLFLYKEKVVCEAVIGELEDLRAAEHLESERG
jgi:hypothetical protein